MIRHENNEASPNQIERFEKRLADWGAYGDYEAFEAWLEYQNKHILPFGGGYLEQPLWIRDSFKQFNTVYNYLYFTRNRLAIPADEESVNPFAKLFSLKESNSDG